MTQSFSPFFPDHNYQRLSKKRRDLAVLVVVEGMPFSAACKPLKLNQTRESQHKILQRVLVGDTDLSLAEPEAVDGVGVGIYDQARRLDELIGAKPTNPYPGCHAAVKTHPDSFLAKELDIHELAVHPTPLDPARLAKYREYAEKYVSPVPNPEAWIYGCQPGSTFEEPAGRYLCSACGKSCPATIAKRLANPYA